jgi:hypothetical protein
MADRTVKVRLEAQISQYEAAMAKAGISTKSLGHTVESSRTAANGSWKSMALGLRGVGTDGVRSSPARRLPSLVSRSRSSCVTASTATSSSSTR